MMKRIDELEPYIGDLLKCFILHSVNVGKYVQMMADELCRLTNTKKYSYAKLPVPDMAYLIGKYHDIGKSGISNELWQKNAFLSYEEYKLVQTHTVIGAHLIIPHLSLRELTDGDNIYDLIAECCMFHHERWDGSGYPFGYKGEQIPLYARIVALADCFDAMTEERPYKEKMSEEDALEEIQQQKGKQFDPVLTDIFCNAMLRRKESV